MKCLKCGMEVKDNSAICPSCGSSIEKNKIKFDEDEFVELPVLKKDNKSAEFTEKDSDMLNSLAQKFETDVSLEKTKTIKPLEDKDEFSLIEDINKQINMVNEEKEKEINSDEVKITQVKEPVVVENKENNNALESKESVNKRTKILLVTTLVTVIVIALIFGGIKLFGNNFKGKASGNLQVNLNEALNDYYETGKTEDLSKILDTVKDKDEELEEVHSQVKEKSDEWLNEYFETEYGSQSEFNSETTRYKDLFRGLYEYAMIKDGNDYVRALANSDYEEINQQIDVNYSDSRLFYEALDLYNDKDYNKAYYALNQIQSNSVIYTKTRIYVDRIVSNVLGLLKSDIAKIEQDITNLSDEDTLKMYTQIEQIIIDYDRVYINLDLTKNTEYSDLLIEYRGKVAAYNKQ